ncbi:MAG: hypothetical protein ABIQ02_12375 [Saprospiraceae bacterium]
MKLKLFFSLGLILVTNLSYSQIENQWLIWNTSGRDGTVPGPNNFVSPISTQFTLMGIIPPDRVTNPKAKNDIFVIYADGQHFNSRAMNSPVYFYNAADFTASPMVTDHKFVKDSLITGLAKVQYLYLTNRYEGDDPPASVRALSNSHGNTTTPYTISTTKSPMLSADHDVVLNKDISVIINYDSLRAFITKESQGEATYELSFDGIQRKGSLSVSYGIDVLNLQPVFGTSITSPLAAVYNGSTLPPPAGERIPLNPGLDHYGYINLRKTSTAFPPLSNGDPQVYAVFTLTKNNQFVRALAEPIRASHDPNYLEVKSICQAADGSYIVTYHLQFENTSTVQANKLKVKVEFPPQFDLSCLKIVTWHVVQACTGSLKITGNTCMFIFKNIFSIIHDPTDISKGIGYVEFKVKVTAGFNLADPVNSLALGTPTVYFDQLDFPLEEFRDLVVCKEKGVTRPDMQEDSTIGDSLKNDGKTSDSDKKDKPSNSSQADDMGHMIFSDPPEGGSFFCMRPISHGNCKCNTPFNWKYVLFLVAITALVIVFFGRSRKKKKP